MKPDAAPSPGTDLRRRLDGMSDEEFSALPEFSARLLRPALHRYRELRADRAVRELKQAWCVLTEEWLAA
jgi:hypothetical protein